MYRFPRSTTRYVSCSIHRSPSGFWQSVINPCSQIYPPAEPVPLPVSLCPQLQFPLSPIVFWCYWHHCPSSKLLCFTGLCSVLHFPWCTDGLCKTSRSANIYADDSASLFISEQKTFCTQPFSYIFVLSAHSCYLFYIKHSPFALHSKSDRKKIYHHCRGGPS